MENHVNKIEVTNQFDENGNRRVALDIDVQTFNHMRAGLRELRKASPQLLSLFESCQTAARGKHGCGAPYVPKFGGLIRFVKLVKTKL